MTQRRLMIVEQARRPARRTSALAAVLFAAAALAVFLGLLFAAGYIIGKLLL